MLHVVVAASRMMEDRSKCIVTVESDIDGPSFGDAFAELESMQAVQLAQRFAAEHGCSPPCLNGNKIGPYPVNSDNVPLDMVKGETGAPLPPQHPKMQPKRYRIEVPIARSMR